MQGEEEKELQRKLIDAIEENKRLCHENKKLRAMLESFSIKTDSSLKLSEYLDNESLLSKKDIEFESERKIKDKVGLFRRLFYGREDVCVVSAKSGHG